MTNKKSIFIKFFVVSCIMLASCTNPMNRNYSPQTYEEDLLAIQKSNKISDEDLQLLAKYILLVKLSGNDITGKSYRDILERIKDFQQKSDDVNTRNVIENEARAKRLAPLLEVNLQSKEFSKIKNKGGLVYTVKIRNISSRKMKTITGNINISDLLENPVKQLSIFVDEDILPGRTITKIYSLPYNNSDESDRRIRSKNLLEMHVVWNPEKIIFEDGTMAE